MKACIDRIRVKASDIITDIIASWTFVFIYTTTMIAWIILHFYGILSIDSEDYMKYNLLLSWFAGTQASIVLMSGNRQSERDRKAIIKGIELDQRQIEHDQKESVKMNEILKKVNDLETILYVMEQERQDYEQKQ